MTTHEKINIDDLFGADDADADADNAVGPEVVRRPTRTKTPTSASDAAGEDLKSLVASLNDGDGGDEEHDESEDPFEIVTGAGGVVVDDDDGDDPEDEADVDALGGLFIAEAGVEDTSDISLSINGNDILREEFNDYLVVDDSVGDEAQTFTDAEGVDEDQEATLNALAGVLAELRDQLTRTTARADEVLAGIEAALGRRCQGLSRKAHRP